jgi:parallel beta-helix repeat protein
MGGNTVGIDIINCYNVTVYKFTIKNFPSYGIQVNSKSNNYVNDMHIIKDCIIEYNSGSGIALRCEGSNTHVKNCVIENCELNNNQFGIYIHNTRDGTNNYNNTITKSYIHDNN